MFFKIKGKLPTNKIFVKTLLKLKNRPAALRIIFQLKIIPL